MRMLMFDYRESEEEFFKHNQFSDIDITFIKEPLNEMSNLSEEQLSETDVISIFITSNLCENVLKKFKNLRIVATRSTGYNHIDVKYCSQNNIAVFNVEEYGQTSVAQYTFALILALVRNIFPAYYDIQKNIINHPDYEGRDLDKLTLGIIGCGSIGSSVAKIANSFGMNVLVHSYAKRNDVSEFAEYTTLEYVLRNSDIITLHLPYSTEVYHMLGENEFNMIKDGAYIVNTARGELINNVVLYENLISGKIKGAALDVFECEHITIHSQNIIDEIKDANSKCVTSALVMQKLLGMENVIVTPHIAYNTQESIDTLLKTTFNNIRDYSKGLHSNRVC